MRTISAKVNDEFFEYVDELAKQKNISISELIKQAILHSKIEDKKAKQIISYELNRIGNNLNQIARYCNTKKGIDKIVLEKLIKIEKEISELINDL